VRQRAIDDRHQRRGIGTELMRLIEHTARGEGIRKLTMHARLSARGFYERLGYKTVSDRFVEVTIPHVGMEKDLRPEE
jgi:ribosomal protein S18 acetylase RimI-like enzyme